MSAGVWSTPEELFAAALALAPAERAELLDGRCTGDPALRDEVESLLAASDAAGAFLDAPAFGAPPAPAWTPGPRRDRPDRIGRYTVRGILGAGGMGAVYRAESDHPRRKVALKVIRPGLVSPAMLRRIEHEAQVLALLQHPGVATLFEAGTADAGSGPQPYFAMELINGPPLTDHARAHRLGTRERLALFIEVCDAVQHAHQKGVIHRDLKPANILVEESGERARPKVLDFGVARSAGAGADAGTLHTKPGQIIGTLAYMSPEQVSGDPAGVDTRTDIYALGVVLYELLTGRLPYDVRDKSVPDAAVTIRDRDPIPLGSADPTLRGDLDTIVAKALEKDRSRRYQSASELAADIQRYLRDEPIVARPASAFYHLGKFARRNRALVGGVVGIVAALVVGLAAAAALLVRATAAERTALEHLAESERARAHTLAFSRFLDRMLTSTEPGFAQGRDTSILREMLDAAARDAASSLGATPEVRASVRLTLGGTYRSLGLFDEAEPLLRGALDDRRRALGDRHPDTVHALGALAEFTRERGDLAAAERLGRETLAAYTAVLGPDDPDTLLAAEHLAGIIVETMGDGADAPRLAEAAALCRRALDGFRASGDAYRASLTLVTLSAVHEATAGGSGREEDLAAGEAALREALRLRRSLKGNPNSSEAGAHIALGRVLRRKGDLAAAESHIREGLAIRERLLTGRHTAIATGKLQLALVLSRRGRHAEAAVLCREAAEIRAERLGADHPYVTHALADLADVLTAALHSAGEGDSGPEGGAGGTSRERLRAEAVAAQLAVLERLRAEDGPEHPRTLARRAAADALAEQARHAPPFTGTR